MAISYVGAGAVVRNVVNPTVAVPAGVVERDLLIIITTSSGASTVPTGWTTRFVGANVNISIFYKFADATNPSVTIANASTGSICAVMIAYRGVGASDTISAVKNATATNIATNTLVTSFPNEYVISVYTSDSNTNTWGVPASTTARVNAGGVSSSNGLLVVDELQAAAGTSTIRTATVTTSRLLSCISFAIIPGGENKYWVGGTGTWNTTSTTNWSLTSGGAGGAIPPGINDSAIFDQASTYTVTMTGALACFDMTVSAGTVTFATGTTPTLAVSANMTLVAGTIWTNTGALTFTAINSTRTVTTNGVTINSPITFLGSGNTGGAWSLGSALTTAYTVTTTLTNGSLILNGFNLNTAIFSSSNANTRSINFGTKLIVLLRTNAGQTALDMANATGFTWTGTGGFSAFSNNTGTYVFGTTGGTSSNAPNLTIVGSDTAVQTFTTGSWFNKLNFGVTAFNPGTTSLNLNSLTLSSGGTFTGLTVTMVASGTITPNGKTVAALTVNNGAGTVTLDGALGCSTYTHTAGTIDFATFNLTCSAGASYAAGTLNNIGTISCTTWTETGTFALSSGTISASTSFTVTSGAFTYNVGGTISTPVFVHTAGTVALNRALTLTTSYTLTAGTLTLASNLTTGSFITTGTGVRAIQFSTNQILLTGNNATIWDGGGANISYTGTVTIVSNYTGSVGTRTINVGTGWTEATAFDVKAGSAVGISIGTSGTDTVAIAGNLDTLDLTGMNFTYSPGVMTVYVDYTIPSTGGTVSASANTTTFASTNVTPRIITVSRSIDFPITFSGVGGTFNLSTSLTTGATRTTTIVSGTIGLNGFNLTTGIFASTGTATRAIAFGSNNIILSSATPATTVLSFATATGFTYTGTGGFTSDAAVTKTYVFGTTGGTLTNAPNLTLTGSGTAIQTFTTASWFDNLDFGSTAFAVPVTALNIAGSLTLSSGGTFTSLSVNILGTGTITPNGKTIAAFTVNNGAGTVTLAGALGVTTYTQTAGTIDFATFNLTGSGAAAYTAGTLNNIGTITCTSWTVTGAFTFGQGTITPSTSFVLTSGSFTYNSGATLSPVPTFTHTAGTVTLGQNYSLTSTGTYTLVAGTLNMTDRNLIAAAFITSGTGVRAINFGTSGYGEITVTGNNTTIWDGGGANITYTGNPRIVATYTGATGTRTVNLGTSWTEATAFDVQMQPGSYPNVYGFQIINGSTDIIAMSGVAENVSLTGFLFTFTPGVMTVYGDYTIDASGGTVSASASTTTFATTSSKTITISRTIDFPITFSGVGGTFNLGANLTTGATRTTTLTSGTLVLNGYNYSTGLFSSAGALARAINFGTNSITVSGSGTVWTTATITNLTISGTPVVNVTNASATATTVLPGALPENQSISFNFTAGTYALTFLNTAEYTAKNVNFTGFVGTLAATAACTVYGSYTISSGMTVTASANVLTFGATSGTNIITASGKTMPPITIDGLGGTFNISGSLTTSGLFRVLAGTFSTTVSNHNITCTQFDSSTNTSARSISLNGSTVTISGTAGITLNSTNLTFNAGTSQITLTNATGTVISFIGGGTFYNVSCTGGGTVALSTVNTYNNLTLTNGPTVPSVVTVSDTQTINGVFASVSTNASTRLTLQSIIDGVQETISAGSVSLSDVDFQDIYAAGATIPWTGTRLGNLGDNTNITFNAGINKYWSLAAGGNWNAVAWATSSGGTPSVNNFPLPQDTCIIENTGLNTSATITINANWNIGSMNMSSRTTAMTLAIGVTTPFIYGSWINGSGYTITGTGTVNFVGQDAIQTITGSAITFTPNININTVAQTVQLGSALTMGATSTFRLTSGVLSLNGYNLTTGIFDSNNLNTRSINFGSNNIILSHTTAAQNVLSMSNNTGFTYTGTGGFTSGMSVTRTFTCATTTSVSGSLLFSNANYLQLPTNSVNQFGTNNFTIEGWVYLNSAVTAANRLIWYNYTPNFTTNSIFFGGHASYGGRITFWAYNANTAAPLLQDPTVLTSGVWTHLAVVRDGSNFTLYRDGVSVSTATSTASIVDNSYTFGGYIGTSGTTSINGYLSNFRIVNGVAVYTGNFTPPISPLTATQSAGTNISDITGTQTTILLNTPNNGSFLSDNSINNLALTNVGTVTANALTPITVLPAAGVSPNLAINSGASIPTLTSGSTFNILDFTGSTCIPAATVVNLNSNLVLASGGTYTALSVSMNGSGTNTITGNSKTIAALTFTAGTNSIADTLTCTIFTINGANFNFASGTLTPTTSVIVTTGSFIYGGTATLGAVPTFTQTGGAVTFSKVYALTATGTYTLTSGTLTLNGFDLTTGIFASNNTNTRAIVFGSNNIILSHTTAATTVLNMANTTGFGYTGTGGFISGMGVTRTFTCATTAAVSGSVLFNGTNQYLTVPNNSAFLFGAGDFTVETWIYITSWPVNAQNQGQIAGVHKSASGYSWQLTIGSIDHNLGFTWNGAGGTSTPVDSLTLNTWYHVAASRIGSTVYLYINGVLLNSATIPTLNSSTDPLIVAANRDAAVATWYIPGYISNLRIVKGLGVYTGNFTVPTSPLTVTQPAGTNISAITGTQTSLLLNTPNSASFLQDSSTNNFTVTNNNTATANALTPITVFPPAGTPPNLAINSGASIPTITTNSTFNILDFTGSTCIPAATVVNVEEGLTLASGGTYTSLGVTSIGLTSIITNAKTIAAFLINSGGNPTLTGSLNCTTLTVNGGYFDLSNTVTLTPSTSITITTGTFIYGGTATLASVATFTQTAGAVTLKAYSLTATGTYTLTSGTLTLNGDLTTGIFSSTNTNSRSINFDVYNIILSHTTAATTVLSMGDTTGFVFTGTGGFTSGMSVTRTFTCGTTAAISGSILFNGSSQYLSRATNAAFNPGGSNYTVEAWIYITSYADANQIFSVMDSGEGGGDGSYGFGTFNNNGRLYFVAGATNYLDTTGPVVPLNTWSHVALVRSGTTYRVWLNGSTSTSTVQTLNMNGGGGMRIGRGRGTSTNYFNGYISNLRMVKGVAVYTGAFTPSTSPLTATQPAGTNISAITGTQTSLLLNTPNNASFLQDFSTYNFTLTNNGTATSNASTPITTFPAAGVPPNLAINSGASIPTITTNSTFNTLNFTGSTCIPAATVVNFNENLVLASGGTYTSLSAASKDTGTITPNGKTIAAFTVDNINGTTTLAGALAATTYTQTSGTMDFATFNLTCSGAVSYTGGILSNIGTITCTTFTLSGADFTFSSGTITPSTSFVVTSGAFTYNSPAVLSVVPTFTHTAGNVTLNQAYSLSATGTYTLSSGTLSLTGDLTTGIFSSTNTNLRSISFGTNNIVLSHTTAAQTVLNMSNQTNFSCSGTGGFASPMSVSRTFTSGTTGSSVSGSLLYTGGQRLSLAASSAFDLSGGTWTVEFWMNSTAAPTVGNSCRIFMFGANNTFTGYYISYNSDGSLLAGVPRPVSSISTAAGVISLNTWYHVAIVSNAGSAYIYVNGVAVAGPVTILQPTTSSPTLFIGYDTALTVNFQYQGYLSNIRITKGVAVYTGNFVVPVSPLNATQSAGTNISAITGTQTSLLLNTPNNAYFLTDSSTNNFTVTNNGSITGNAATPITVLPAAGTPPNLRLTSGASVPTLTTGSNYNILDFTGSSTTPPATSLNIASGLTLSSGGTYTGLTISSTGATNFTGNNKTIAALSLNNGTSTATVDTTGLVVTGAVTMLQGALSLNGNLSSTSLSCAGSSRSITGTNTTYTITGSGTSAWNYSPTGSMLLNGTTQYLTIPSSTALQLATATPFTIEAWIYSTNMSAADHGIIGKRQAGNEWQLNIHPSFGYLNFWNGVTTYQSNITLVVSTWYHVAVSWDTTTLRFFVNGVMGTTHTGFTVSASTNQVTVGGVGLGTTGLFAGNISNLRLVKGVAVYTGNFTVPTGPLAATQTANPYGGSNTNAITGTQTSLLLNTRNYYDYITDSSTNNFTATNIGSVTYNASSPTFTTGTSGFTCSDFTINMTSATAKTFVGGVGTYPVLNQGGGAALTISGTNTFNNITNTVSGATVTFPTATTTTFNNFSLYGSSTGGGAATGYPLGSVSFNGTNQYLTAPSNAVFAFGTSNFTVEAWVNTSVAFTGVALPIAQSDAVGSSTNNKWWFGFSGTGLFFGTHSSGGFSVITTTAFSAGTWYHVAVTRASGVMNMFINGVSTAFVTTGTPSGYSLSQNGLTIGAISTPRYWNGYISNLRVVNGVAVYTGNFTVLTDPLSATQSASTNIAAITGTQTSLLLNTPNSASFITDSSTNNFTVTNVGTAVASSNSPFLMYINSTTSGTSATITKSSGTVYGSSLSIQDSNATGGATWYAGPTSVSVSNNTGWIFNQLPIINIGNISINGGVTVSNDPI